MKKRPSEEKEMMKQIKITIVIDDPEIVESYKDVHPDLILQDFENAPEEWFPGSFMRAELLDLEQLI